MKKKVIIIVAVIILIVIGLYFFRTSKEKDSSNSLTNEQIINTPPSSSKEYSDPSGFSFNYPDDLSLTKNEITDTITYTDLQLFSGKVSGSLNLKITDSKFTSIEEWLKLNNKNPKEVKLGNLAASEIELQDRLLLGALDKGILFTIEIPLIEKDYWMKVYNQVLTSFNFIAPDNISSDNTAGSTEDVSFEGEEIVE